MAIHKNYTILTDIELAFVDSLFDVSVFDRAKADHGITLNTTAACERAVEAVATWVVASRPQVTEVPMSVHEATQAVAAERVDPKPDFTVSGNPGDTVFLLRPNTEEAEKELRDNVGPEAQWLGKALAVEHRYIGDAVEQLQANGFTVEGF